MPELSARLHFKCPEDFQLLELSDLSQDISLIYNKFQLAIEGENVFQAYHSKQTLTRGPDEKLILRKITYGSDLIVVAAGAGILSAVIAAISLYFQLKKELSDMQEENFSPSLRHEILKQIMKKNPELGQPIHDAAENLRIDEDKLLDYVEPELLDLIAERPVLVEANTEKQTVDKQ